MNKAFLFDSVGRFYYKNRHFEMFLNENNRITFLEVLEDDTYKYLDIKTYMELSKLIFRNPNVRAVDEIKYKRRSKKRKKIIPRILVGGTLVAVTAATINIFSQHKDIFTTPKVEETQVVSSSEITESNDEIITIPKDVSTPEEITTTEEEELTVTVDPYVTFTEDDIKDPVAPVNTPNSIDNKYLSLMALGEDELDYLWDNDYEVYEKSNLITVSDSKSYSEIFDFEKPTVEDLISAINSNDNIPDKYKEYFIGLVTDYLTLYPETDFSLLYYNLFTLRINECTPNVIQSKTGSSTTSACYVINENQIYINQNTNISNRSNDDWIILGHEFLHAAKSAILYDPNSNYKFMFVFFENSSFGFYTEEALNTYFMYEVQGLNYGSIHYTIASNYYRVILDCLEGTYDGADFINHSVNYLPYLMDNFMEQDQGAYKCIAMIESISSLYYTPNVTVDYNSFSYLNEYITRMYCKKYLEIGMSADEAEAVFDKLMEELTYNFNNLARPYDGIKEEYFRPTFENCCSEHGIRLSKSL